MESQPNRTPLIVIVGQTASGKSALALELAKRFNGEIVCADSRTVYRGMDIGTAKPSKEEQKQVPHHLLDILSPDQPLTVAEFKRRADEAIERIRAKGKVPFLVGGTGLYVDAVAFNFSFRGEPDYARRQDLEQMSVGELQALLKDQGVPLPANATNPRHLIRQIETGGERSIDRTLRPETLFIGIEVEKEILQRRIAERVDKMFDMGLENEVQTLVDRYGWSHALLQTIGYKEFQDFFAHKTSPVELRQRIVRDTLQYAKRQKTWFKRNKYVHWTCKPEEVVDLITTQLNKNYITN